MNTNNVQISILGSAFSEADLKSINWLIESFCSAPEPVTERLVRALPRETTVMLARSVDTGEIVGMGAIAVVSTLTGKHGIIKDVGVLRKYSGRHVYEGIINSLLSQAIACDLPYAIALENDEAVGRLYISLNFRPTETGYRIDLKH